MDKADMNNRRPDRPAWARWADVLLRTAHIGASGVLLGGHVLSVDRSRLGLWLGLTIGTGLGLIASEVYHSRHWPYQGRGLMVWVKLALLAVLGLFHEWRVPILAAAVVIGSVGSHMPKRFRHWSFVHRAVVD
jgi:hypothetical protein